MLQWVPVLAVFIIPLIEIPIIYRLLKRYINKKYEAEKQAITDRLIEFITPGGTDEAPAPSELAVLVDNIFKSQAPNIGKYVYQSIMGNINQVKSVVSKNLDQAEQEQVTQGLMTDNPLAAIAYNMVPKNWKKKLASNPALISQFLGGGGGPGPGNNGNNNSYTERRHREY